MKKAVIIYGPPGSGKGTQAELLVRVYNFVNFDTGRYLEKEIYSPQNKNNKIIQREKELFESGKLCSPEFVLKIVKNQTKKISASEADIVYSGSPRTIFEAFGDKKNDGLIYLLTKLFGKKNIYIFYLEVPPSVSLKRNSKRRVCSVCGLQVLPSAKHISCPLCSGKLKVRTLLDNPETIVKRLKEFKERTFPIVVKLKKNHFNVFNINGRPAPFIVHKKIVEILKLTDNKKK
jgi:adenylate kinase